MNKTEETLQWLTHTNKGCHWINKTIQRQTKEEYCQILTITKNKANSKMLEVKTKCYFQHIKRGYCLLVVYTVYWGQNENVTRKTALCKYGALKVLPKSPVLLESTVST